jgi:hypothetical protein
MVAMQRWLPIEPGGGLCFCKYFITLMIAWHTMWKWSPPPFPKNLKMQRWLCLKALSKIENSEAGKLFVAQALDVYCGQQLLHLG